MNNVDPVEFDAEGYPVVFHFPTEVNEVCQGIYGDGVGACCSIGWINMNFYGTPLRPWPRTLAPYVQTVASARIFDLVHVELTTEAGESPGLREISPFDMQELNDMLMKAQIVKAWGRVAERLGYVESCDK